MVNLRIDIPDGFLDEEIRDGFSVSKERKEMWAIELDLLMQLDKVCKNNGLKYCVGAGTLLGAIRHKGFIPWDDDIDVYMLRADYDKLMKLTDQFPSPYVLQNIYTSKNRITWFTRLRNKETTGATEREIYTDMCKGIFIDVFPLDGITSDMKANLSQRRKNLKLKTKCQRYNAIKSIKPSVHFFSKLKRIILKGQTMFYNPVKLQKKYDDNLKKYSIAGTEMWGNRTLVFECPKSRRPYSDWTDLVNLPFEFVSVPVPRNYDAMLKQQYGDYMKIPENKGGNMHGELIISTQYAYDDPRRLEEK